MPTSTKVHSMQGSPLSPRSRPAFTLLFSIICKLYRRSVPWFLPTSLPSHASLHSSVFPHLTNVFNWPIDCQSRSLSLFLSLSVSVLLSQKIKRTHNSVVALASSHIVWVYWIWYTVYGNMIIYFIYLFFKVASHCALCADKISAKEKQHNDREKRREREEEAEGDREDSGNREEGADRKGEEERKVASNCLENESKRAEKSRKLKMNQRTAPPIAGGNPKQRRTQGGG